jgi:hypothetical protein
MGTAVPGRSPHHPQGELFAGIGAAGVKEMPSRHDEEVIPDKCAYCHMFKEGEEVVTEGGHTFLPDVKACAVCHTDPEAMIAVMHEDVVGLLDGVTAMLDAVPEEEREADAYKEALFNVEMVEVDGSHGVHNYSYAKAALGHSYAALGATAPIVDNCAVCHSESTEYKEWETSAHAHSLETLGTSDHAGDSCLRCMSSSILEDPETTFEMATASITCSMCHNHGTGLEHNLQVSAAENCTQCHTMGTAEPGGSPHHPQAEIFAGIGGAGVEDMPSGHDNTMPDKCATCHMYKSGEEMATEGGHTFHPTMESCNGCHADAASITAEAQTKTTTLLESLGVALDAVPEEEREMDAYKEAKFNYDMVSVDGSHGVHNYAYASALLEHAYSALGVEMPTIDIEVPGAGKFTISLASGLNMLSLPLKPAIPYTARSLMEELGSTVVITYDTARGKFVGFTADHSGDGFDISGGGGYIVNLTAPMDITFEGTIWSNAPSAAASLLVVGDPTAWAFVATGFVHDSNYEAASSGEYVATVRNLRTGASASDVVGISGDGLFTAVWANLSRKSVVEVGDSLEIVIKTTSGEIVSGPVAHQIDVGDIRRAFINIPLELGNIIPEKNMLAQNYPNPFNPDTWIPYQLAEDANVTIRIYSKHKAAYWNGKDDNSESVASGIYLYSIHAGDFTSVRKMVILK